MTTISRLLRMIRLQHGELMHDMAQKLNVTSAFLSAVENGRKPVPSSWLSILSEQYNLSEQQIDELRCAFNDTIKQVRISLDGAPSDRRDLALSFARRFDELDHEDIAAFMDILSRK